MFIGYGIWTICLICHQSSKNYFVITLVTLALEITILTFAPWFIWLMDAPYQAGTTFVSQYSLIIFIRWFVVLIFQYTLISSTVNFFLGLVTQLLETLTKLSHHSAADTPNLQNEETVSPLKKSVGRPKKSN